MSEFRLYLQLGLDHILDIAGYDHILFVVVLCASYMVSDWKKILVLVTAFTVGHSITLALATLRLIKVNTDLIEYLIPLTILLTAITNLFTKDRNRFTPSTRKVSINYLLAGFFGLIHGLGFSSYLRSLLGKDQTILTQLLAFNIGLEIGQIFIVAIFLLVSFLFVGLFGVDRRDWKIIMSSAIGGIALTMMMDAKYWT